MNAPATVASAGIAGTSQPLEIFRRMPPSCIAHAAADDRNAPIIRAGEIVVVEGNGRAGWLPTEGEIFLIEYVSPPQHGERYERRTRDIVQTYLTSKGEWWAGSVRRGLSPNGRFYPSDGPYRDELALAGKLIGRVVGLLAPYTHMGETLRG